MEDYRNRIQNMLEKIIGTRDVTNLDYKQIDENTSIEDLDLRGFSTPDRVLLPRDSDKIVSDFLSMKLT